MQCAIKVVLRYVDKGTQYYEQKHHEQQLHLLKKKAATLGFQVVEIGVA
jgi:hypothetical protein